MKQSQLFVKTSRQDPKDEPSLNARLLLRAGFVDKLSAGIYTYLPLGLRVLRKIQEIIRKEMNAAGALEILMPALTPKEIWVQTGRWEILDVLFRLQGAGDKEFALGATHEEVVTPLIKKFVQSEKDLPLAVFQIQDKFRNEPRAKSGLLRGREFNMKDMYSFHADQKNLEEFYEKIQESYSRVFSSCGLEALLVEASGGSFSPFSHEYQVLTPYGEDEIHCCDSCKKNQNKEIVKEPDCPYCGSPRRVEKAIEVGNIFKLKDKFSSAFDFNLKNEAGEKKSVLMGCYGIGPSRVLGAVVETHNDENGIIWPESIAPFKYHLISLAKTDEEKNAAQTIYQNLTARGEEVLFDDRENVSAGEKFADSDLIGIPYRILLSAKTYAAQSVEKKNRQDGSMEMIKIDSLIK